MLERDLPALASSLALATILGCAHLGEGRAELSVEAARARVLPNHGGAVYLRVINRGGGADALVSAEASWAARVELHEVLQQGDFMQMRPVLGGVEVEPRSTLVFEPGGRHLMLQGVSLDPAALHAPMTLRFAKTGPLTVDVAIQSKEL
jgi:copper(I)-binding protein